MPPTKKTISLSEIERRDAIAFEYQERVSAKWQLCPSYIAFEDKGSLVLLDDCGRPICRSNARGKVQILAPTAEFATTQDLVKLSYDFRSPKGRDYVLELIEDFGIRGELRKRWDLQHRRQDLRGWAHK